MSDFGVADFPASQEYQRFRSIFDRSRQQFIWSLSHWYTFKILAWHEPTRRACVAAGIGPTTEAIGQATWMALVSMLFQIWDDHKKGAQSLPRALRQLDKKRPLFVQWLEQDAWVCKLAHGPINVELNIIEQEIESIPKSDEFLRISNARHKHVGHLLDATEAENRGNGIAAQTFGDFDLVITRTGALYNRLTSLICGGIYSIADHYDAEARNAVKFWSQTSGIEIGVNEVRAICPKGLAHSAN